MHKTYKSGKCAKVDAYRFKTGSALHLAFLFNSKSCMYQQSPPWSRGRKKKKERQKIKKHIGNTLNTMALNSVGICQ